MHYIYIYINSHNALLVVVAIVIGVHTMQLRKHKKDIRERVVVFNERMSTLVKTLRHK